MRHTTALAIKFLAVTAILALVLPLVAGPVSWTGVLVAALAVTVVSYLAGDLGILPAMGQVMALVGDLLLGAVTVWAVQFIVPGLTIPFAGALVVAVALGVAEFFFHRYMQGSVLRTRRTAEQK